MDVLDLLGSGDDPEPEAERERKKKCEECGRPLTHPASVARGMGEVCFAKVGYHHGSPPPPASLEEEEGE